MTYSGEGSGQAFWFGHCLRQDVDKRGQLKGQAVFSAGCGPTAALMKNSIPVGATFNYVTVYNCAAAIRVTPTGACWFVQNHFVSPGPLLYRPPSPDPALVLLYLDGAVSHVNPHVRHRR